MTVMMMTAPFDIAAVFYCVNYIICIDMIMIQTNYVLVECPQTHCGKCGYVYMHNNKNVDKLMTVSN